MAKTRQKITLSSGEGMDDEVVKKSCTENQNISIQPKPWYGQEPLSPLADLDAISRHKMSRAI